MTEKDPGTRDQEHVIEIDASPDDVWRAISEAEEVTRWYVVDAEIDGRVGGTYRVSWGEGMEGVSDITVFEPGRHLRIEHRPHEGAPDLPGGPIVEEYFIERAGDRTVLRLVTSGIPDTEDWDWFYEGTKRGWPGFFLGLRHYLERHPGVPRDQIVRMTTLPGTGEEAWAALLGPSGLGLEDAEGTDEGTAGGMVEGRRYRASTAFGEEIEGRLLRVHPPHRLIATVEPLDHALLTIAVDRMGPSEFLYFSLSTFGLSAEALAATRERWLGWLDELFPADGAAAEASHETLPPSGGADA